MLMSIRDDGDDFGEAVDCLALIVVDVLALLPEVVGDLHHLHTRLQVSFLVLLDDALDLLPVGLVDVLLEVLQEHDVEEEHPAVAREHDVLAVSLHLLGVLAEGGPGGGLDLVVHGRELAHLPHDLGHLEHHHVQGVDQVDDVVAGVALLLQVHEVVVLVLLPERVHVVVQDVLQLRELLLAVLVDVPRLLLRVQLVHHILAFLELLHHLPQRQIFTRLVQPILQASALQEFHPLPLQQVADAYLELRLRLPLQVVDFPHAGQQRSDELAVELVLLPQHHLQVQVLGAEAARLAEHQALLGDHPPP